MDERRGDEVDLDALQVGQIICRLGRRGHQERRDGGASEH